MSKSLLLATWLLIGVGSAPSDPGQEPARKPVRHAVVVHVDNKLGEPPDVTKATVKKLFLKDLSQWPDGTAAKAYARDEKSEAHARFRNEVLAMSEAELARHWLRAKSLNGTTPPKQVDSDRLVLKYVARNPGAFGIVELDAAKNAEGVRILLEF